MRLEIQGLGFGFRVHAGAPRRPLRSAIRTWLASASARIPKGPSTIIVGIWAPKVNTIPLLGPFGNIENTGKAIRDLPWPKVVIG